MNERQQAAAVFNRHAHRYQEKYWHQPQYVAGLEAFCDALGKGDAALLDVGCGPGNVAYALLQKNPDLHLLGIDLAPEMVALAQKNVPTAQFEVMDVVDLDKLNRRFDGIIFSFIFPYLPMEAVQSLMTKASALLNPGGLIYLSTMEGDHARSRLQVSSDGQDSLQQYFYRASDFQAMFNQNGLHGFYRERLPFPVPEGAPAVTDLILIARKP